MSNYNKLQEVLKEIFEMDKADLDFGIYRIMNQKRDQVMDFIDRKLPKDIKDILAQTQSKDSAGIQAELDKAIKSAQDLGVDPDALPKVIELKAQLNNAIDTNALEQEVFSHLANFFKRYYKDGDFISLRRYKKDVYAIPYEGEEVKLHWANHDQYYIKTSEYLKNYSFKLKDGKSVHFQLKEASTEQNNNKAQGDQERRFAIYEEQPVEVIDGQLYINFTYERHKKTVKQEDLAKHAFEVLQKSVPGEFALAFDKAPTEKNKNRTIVEKHLNDFISRNSFDYFIHKDLGGFLRRELDFYIKNEVLYIDDINTENPAFFTAQLSKIKALKTVASKIITFLAQIEDFQKKLWLKKKFVISTNYCITLDRIPEKYYPEIVANQAQLDEWKELFDVSLSLSKGPEALKEEPYLVLDTKFFSEAFKDKLLAEFDNLDEETNGLLINSENFQALNVMQEKFQEKIKTIYIDPPYNTNASEIIYKNGYKDSSWLSLINDRINISKHLNSNDGIINVAIDDFELSKLSEILNGIYGFENKLGNYVVVHNPGGRHDDKFIATAHEYNLVYSKSIELAKTNLLPLEETDIESFKFIDEVGKYRTREFRRSGNNSTREARPYMFYPIFYNKETQEIKLLNEEDLSLIFNKANNSFNDELLNKFKENNKKIGFDMILPIDPNNIFRVWRWSQNSLKERLADIIIECKKGDYYIKVKDRLDNKEGLKPKSVWYKPQYTAALGTKCINDLFGLNLFSYPKSVATVKDVLYISDTNKYILDYFAGSGTTGHATIKLNREDGGNRKYILVEMGTYFNTVTKPRIQKVIYTDNWKNGKPQDKVGISQMFKYQVLESYEDTLNNLQLPNKTNDALLNFEEQAQEEYLLNYMLDVETQDHLFNVQMFRNPFNYQLKVTENNELVPTTVDLVETFNYLIGLYVEWMQRVGDIKFVEGKTREGIKTLVIWRNLETTSNEETAQRFRKIYDSVRSSEFDQIYINGDHHFDNMRTGEDTFKVKLIEETFFKKMFNVVEW